LSSHCTQKFSVIFQRKFRFFFGKFQFFNLQAEVPTFKLEFPEKFASFTEVALFFTLSQIFAPRAEHPCTRIRRAIFADAGFKMLVRTADPEVSSILFPGLLHNVDAFSPDFPHFPISSLFHTASLEPRVFLLCTKRHDL
jgi:hypothetical protein